MRKQAAFLLSILIFSLFMAEAGLRLAGGFLEAPQRKLNQIEPADASRLRILTLGESTTADFCIRSDRLFCNSWPRQLETMLREKGIDSRVYNEAVPGISTPFILQRLPGWLQLYHPQIVISMMGVNDLGLRSDLIRGGFLQELRVLKVARWAYNALLGPRLNLDDQGLWSEEYHRLSPEVQKLDIKLWEREVPRRIQGLRPHEQGFLWGQLGNNCQGISEIDSTVSLKECRIYAERGYRLFPTNTAVISFLLYIDRKLENYAAMDGVAADILRRRVRLDDELLTVFMTLDPATNPKVWQMLGEYGIHPGSEPPARLFEARLAQIQKLIEEGGATHLRMQYPTLDVRGLARRYHIPDGADLPQLGFIENKENFRTALLTHKFDEVFTDRFEEHWGHTTTYGHSLIAQEVLRAILDCKNCSISRWYSAGKAFKP